MTSNPNIEFFNVDEDFALDLKKVSKWIFKIIAAHNSKCGLVNIIFCTDKELLKMNRDFLKHDYYTDILSFQYNTDPIEGELYISIDRVKANAKEFKQDFEIELLRVVIHGIFHFLGYTDKSAVKKKEMRSKEEEALNLFKNEFIKSDHYFDLVYDVVRCIPKGRVSSYGLIADYLSLGSARMVGWALNQLKGKTLEVPAHRVVNAKGQLSGRMMFGDAGERMGKLLKKEGIPVKNYQIQQFEKYLWIPSKEL